MSKNISDIKNARRRKRDKTGWSIEEVKESAKKELDEFKDILNEEPGDLASGDMDKIISGDEKDD